MSTDGDSTGGSKEYWARHSYGHVPQVAHKVHDGLHQAGEELAFPRGFVQFIIGSIEICEHGVLTIESLDDVVAGVDLPSTWPLTTPSVACCAIKYFWLNLTTSSTSANETGRISSAISVILD